MSIEVMKLALDALNEAVAFREGGRQKAINAAEALRTTLSQQPVTNLPEDVVIGHVTLCKGSNISLLIDHAKRLNADVERLEAEQLVTNEPMTGDERGEAYLKYSKSSEGHRSTFMRGVWAAEAHHDIKPKKE